MIRQWLNNLFWGGLIACGLYINFLAIKLFRENVEHRGIVHQMVVNGPLKYDMKDYARGFIVWMADNGVVITELSQEQLDKLVADYQIVLYKEKIR